MATATSTIDELRASYRRMRDAGRFIFGREWDAAVVATLVARHIDPSEATPTEWVEAAEKLTLTCPKCHGTGLYHWGAYDLTTKKHAHTGDCYQCGGGGTQDMDDWFRNRSHTMHAIVQACR